MRRSFDLWNSYLCEVFPPSFCELVNDHTSIVFDNSTFSNVDTENYSLNTYDASRTLEIVVDDSKYKNHEVRFLNS